MHKPRSSTDLAAGLVFIAIGALAIAVSSSYPMGTAARMGAGFFPVVIGGLLAGLGGILAIKGLVFLNEQSWPRLAVRPFLGILGSIALFGLMVDRAGLVLSTFLLVMLSRLAVPGSKVKVSLGLAAALTAFSYLVFIKGIGLQIPIWPGG